MKLNISKKYTPAIGIALALLAIMLVVLTSTAKDILPLKPETSEYIDDARDEAKTVLIFTDNRSSVYLIKHDGNHYISNSAGGIIEVNN